MAYKPAIVSPSSLAAVEKCPRFRPNGEETEASADGTLYHEHMESIVQLPREEWDGYVEKTEMSNDMRWLVKRSVAELSSLVLEKLEPVKDFRINGIPVERLYVTQDEILAGGVWEFDMTDRPARRRTLEKP